MTMIEIIVAPMPKTNVQTLKGSLKLNSESPAPKKTTAAERGSIPIKVPIKNDESGTRAAVINKFVSANGIAGDNLSKVMTRVVRLRIFIEQSFVQYFRFFVMGEKNLKIIADERRQNKRRNQRRADDCRHMQTDAERKTERPTA